MHVDASACIRTAKAYKINVLSEKLMLCQIHCWLQREIMPTSKKEELAFRFTVKKTSVSE